VAVTQSGETADTIAAARLAGDRGAVVVAVTNTVGSAITREAHASVFLQAGPEVAVAATKTFVTQVATVIMLAADVAERRGCLPAEKAAELVAALRRLPDQAARAIELAAVTEQIAERYAEAAGYMYIGRSFGYRRLSRARSRSRRSAISTPRATLPASSSTARYRSSMPRYRWLPWRRVRRSTTS